MLRKVRKALPHRRVNRSCSGKLVPSKKGNHLVCQECHWFIDRQVIEAKGYDFEAASRAGLKVAR